MEPLYGGVETGGTWCVCALGSGPGRLERHVKFPTTSPDATIARIVEFFNAGPAPAALGVGSFGPLNLDRQSPGWGSVTTTPKPGWQHVSLGPRLQRELSLPVAIEQDVTAAALGEIRWGAAQGLSAVAYVTVGTGIGAGLVLDGRPWHGLLHPEVGHLRIPHDGDSFSGVCPSHGDCWEGLACGPAIEARWGISGAELPDDHPAWELEARHIALGLLSIVAVVSPQRVVLGGGVMERTGLLERVRASVRELAGGYWDTPLLRDRVDEFLVEPALGDDAGVLGAIALAQTHA